MTRNALAGAKRRGLVNGAEAAAARPIRHRRTCPACGGTFLPATPNHRGSCCACCALAWLTARDAGTLDRRVARGVEVILLEDGAVGVVESVPDRERAVVLTEDGRRLTVGPRAVERIQYLDVAHGGDCPRKRGREWVERLSKTGGKDADREDGAGGVEGQGDV